MDFSSTVSFDPPRAHLLVAGEVDAFVAVPLRRGIGEAIDRGCTSFTLDASAVTFFDAGGLGALVWLRNAVTSFGGTLTVVAASPQFHQTAQITGLGPTFELVRQPPVVAAHA